MEPKCHVQVCIADENGVVLERFIVDTYLTTDATWCAADIRLHIDERYETRNLKP